MPKKIPMRQCLGCREMKPKSTLIRVVRAPDGEVSLDPVGKKPGRGAYVCRSAECLRRAIRQKQLERMIAIQRGDDGITVRMDVTPQELEELRAMRRERGGASPAVMNQAEQTAAANNGPTLDSSAVTVEAVASE